MVRWIPGRVKRKIRDCIKYLTWNRARTYSCNVMGIAILLDVESEIEEYRAITYATKEPETLEWIQRYFSADDVMYDIGANVGLYSIFAAKRLGSQGKVYAIEPEALNYAKLNKNVCLNGLSGRVVPCCFAVTDRLCFETFHLHPNIYAPERCGRGLVAGSALHAFGAPLDYQGNEFQPIHQQGMVGVSVDCLWQQFGLDFPNHIKIDVDGLEEKIIHGSAMTLNDSRLKSVLVEISASRGGNDPIVRSMSEAGFKQVNDFAEHSSQQLKGTPYEDCVNTVFVRP